MCPAQRLKSLNFRGIRLGGPLILELPIFVRISSFLISIHFENIIHLALMVKSLKFWWPRLRGIPHFDITKICQTLSFLHICQLMKILCV